MLNVLFTTDVEIWPRHWELTPEHFARSFQDYIYGSTEKGDFGIPYMVSLFNEYDFKTVFFVEALFAGEFGVEPLREIVQLIEGAGQSVEMHLHSEWIGKATHSLLPGKSGINLRNFDYDDQLTMLRAGLEYLRAAGVDQITAFRAGSYGANVDTLRALDALGIPFDSSYNATNLGATSGLEELVDGELIAPSRIHNIWEFPIAHFQDRPGSQRHAQLGACSASELCNALLGAWRADWKHFVIVSHSFELLTPDKTKPDPI
ncbi:MAG: polysaccharide deacetylase, partial [Gammaproteobacteria bacterium]|nr:polysaccharide deacetylase [Gammaproteobacteria bacterium]